MRVGFLVKSWKYKNFKVIMRPHIVFYPNVYSISTNNIVNFLFSFTFLHFFNLLEMVQSLHNCTWLELTLYSWYPAMIRLFVGHKKELGWQVILLCSTFFALGSFSAPIFHLHCYELRWNLNFPPWTSKKNGGFFFFIAFE